jgi:hypothetical protein
MDLNPGSAGGPIATFLLHPDGALRTRHAAQTRKPRHRAESESAPDRIRTCDLRFRRLPLNMAGFRFPMRSASTLDHRCSANVAMGRIRVRLGAPSHLAGHCFRSVQPPSSYSTVARCSLSQRVELGSTHMKPLPCDLSRRPSTTEVIARPSPGKSCGTVGTGRSARLESVRPVPSWAVDSSEQ